MLTDFGVVLVAFVCSLRRHGVLADAQHGGRPLAVKALGAQGVPFSGALGNQAVDAYGRLYRMTVSAPGCRSGLDAAASSRMRHPVQSEGS